ncbi:MAG: hypothetical protein JXP73_20690 [Deltaproteobacteria bacterium]|nr:hypothetical protein [Deltaproteobacteria bacterium]
MRALLTLAVAANSLLPACSSGDLRDMNYGTDAGQGFVPPDTGPRADLPPDTPADQTAALDGGGAIDSSVDSTFDENG